MRTAIVTLVFLTLMIGSGPAVSGAGIPATIASDGSILIAGTMRVPPFPTEGRWTEFEKKSSERHEVRHFNYMVPGSVPALELYISETKGEDAPDGGFEIGLVTGYLRGFASKSGFALEEPVFDRRTIAGIGVQHTLAKMTNGRKTLWISAYTFIRKPSLTFLAVKAKEGEEPRIEQYLSRVEVR